MDGKTGAEELIAKVLKDPDVAEGTGVAPKPQDAGESAEKGKIKPWPKSNRAKQAAAGRRPSRPSEFARSAAEGVQAADRAREGRGRIGGADPGRAGAGEDRR